MRYNTSDTTNSMAINLFLQPSTNSASAGKTFIKMQNQLLNDDDCACFLVEEIAQHSQNIKWKTTVDKKKVGHKLSTG